MERYFHVYYRINAGYVWGVGMQKDESAAFHEDISRIFTVAGWDVNTSKFSAGSQTVSLGKTSLYCHPMEVSGPVREDLIKTLVPTILSEGRTFILERYDIYEELFDMDDDAYRTVLESKRPLIEAALLERYKTKRRTLFKSSSEGVWDVASDFRIKRLKAYQCNTSTDIEQMYVANVFQELIARGDIVTWQTPAGTTVCRTRFKTEKAVAV